jgi:hypothetical protein
MCTRKSTQYLQCGHRKYGNTDTSSCDYYNPKLQCCPKNQDVIEKNSRLCSDCVAHLQETSYYLHFKVRNLGDEYVDYEWSADDSTISSLHFEDYDERYQKFRIDGDLDSMEMNLPAITEEEEIVKPIENVGDVRHRLPKYCKLPTS